MFLTGLACFLIIAIPVVRLSIVRWIAANMVIKSGWLNRVTEEDTSQ